MDDDKIIQIFKIFACTILCIIIGLCALFFIGVTKVDALPELGAFNGSSDVAWWVGYENNNYSCYHNCPSFNRIVIPFYAYTTSTDNKMVFGFNISFRATYQNLYPVVQTANITPYALWSTNNDLWNDWSLIDSCTITGTTEQSGDAVITKTWTYQVSCNASPPSNNHFPTIYFNLYNSNGNTNVVLQEFYTIYNAMTYNVVEGIETGAIIDNNNQNSQNIIDNQTQNKDEIIANQNENTDKITDAIENQNEKCEQLNYNENNLPVNQTGSRLTTTGTIEQSANWKITDYIPLNKDKTYTLTKGSNWGSINGNYCLYNENKNLINCVNYNGTLTFTITNASYIRIDLTVPTGNTLTLTGEYCYNRIDQTNENLNDINDSLNDPTIDSSSISGFNVNEVDTGLTGLITLPLTTINNLLNQTCSPIVLPLPFINKNLTLPCLTPIYQEHFPTILNLWQMVITAIIGYWIAIKIIAMVKGFTDPDDDRIEVLDL